MPTSATKRTLARELVHAFGETLCPVCIRPMPVDLLTQHHILPRCRGGPTQLANLVLLCRPCHDDVHRFPSAFWARASLEGFLSARGDLRPFPPHDSSSVEEGLRMFFHRLGVRPDRAQRARRFAVNPPFAPDWRVGRSAWASA